MNEQINKLLLNSIDERKNIEKRITKFYDENNREVEKNLACVARIFEYDKNDKLVRVSFLSLKKKKKMEK